MATHAHSTRLRAVVPTLPREALEDLIERSLALLDAMDRDPDLEPDHDGEAEPDEDSDQRATLGMTYLPARRGVAFRAPGTLPPKAPPVIPLKPPANSPPHAMRQAVQS